MQPVTLRELLRGGSPPAAHKYFRRIAKMIDTLWDITVGADLAHLRGAPARASGPALVGEARGPGQLPS